MKTHRKYHLCTLESTDYKDFHKFKQVFTGIKVRQPLCRKSLTEKDTFKCLLGGIVNASYDNYMLAREKINAVYGKIRIFPAL